MAKGINPKAFRDTAIIYLVKIMADHEGNGVSPSVVGSIINHMTGWDIAELNGLVNAFGTTDQWKKNLEDSSFLLDYAPRRKFASSKELIEWIVSASSIQEAIDTSAYWGFIPHTRKPHPGAVWNAFLLAGLNILSRSKDGRVEESSILFLFSLLGMNRLAAHRAIAVQKGVGT